MPNQKIRRTIDIPKKLYDIVSLPESKDHITFRDASQYPQFAGAGYHSNVWPEQEFGVDPNDIIRINIYGNNDNLLKTEYLTNNQFESFVKQAMPYAPAVVKLDPGKILRDCGYQQGRFRMDFDFFRVKAGSPFPLLVNGDERIFNGNFVTGSDGYVYAQEEHSESSTVEGDRLYVKENKYILQSISSDRTEIIVSPSFINDDKYLENFRMAGFNCLNMFPPIGPDGLPQAATFSQNANLNLINFDRTEDLSRKLVNGKIRINDAYFMSERFTEEVRDEYEVIPDIEIENEVVNLIEERNLDSRMGWVGHGAWPSPDAVITELPFPLNRAMGLENVVVDSPVGKIGVKTSVINPINASESFLEEVGRSLASIARTNYCVGLTPWYEVNTDIENTLLTFSAYVKAPEGLKVCLFAHSGPWGLGTVNTRYSQDVTMNGEWQRLVLPFRLQETRNNKINLRIIFKYYDSGYDVTSPNIVGEEAFIVGAKLELGGTATPFTRRGSLEDGGLVDVPISNTIKFLEPNGKILTADFSEVEDGFIQKMVGGKITINDGIAKDDLSEQTIVNEKDVETFFENDIIPESSDRGNPGGIAGDYGWDPNLHARAIAVKQPNGQDAWIDGFNWFDAKKPYSHSGTAEFGYHPHWLADEGVDNGPVMFFPDINNQEAIVENLKESALDAWNDPTDGYYVKQGIADPRVDDDRVNSTNWAHRYMAIASKEGYVKPLAAYGIRHGDTIRIQWTQKSLPDNFEEGQRKGASVGLYFYSETTFDFPEEDPQVLDTDVETQDRLAYELFHSNDEGQPNWQLGSYYFDSSLVENLKPLNPPVGYNVPTRPENVPPRPGSDGDKSPGGFFTFSGPESEVRKLKNERRAEIRNIREDNAGLEAQEENRIKTRFEKKIAAAENKKGSWLRSDAVADGWEWNNQTKEWEIIGDNVDFKVGEIVSGIVTHAAIDVEVETEAFGWYWNGYEWESMYIRQLKSAGKARFRYVDSNGELLPVQSFPAESQEIIVGQNKTVDGNFCWNGSVWELSENFFEDNPDAELDRGRPVVRKRTFFLNGENNQDGSSRKYIPCEEYNEWEIAIHEFVIPENFSLLSDVRLYAYGHYGDFGTLYVDDIQLKVVKTAEDRVVVDDSAILAPIEFTIDEVINRETIRVSKTYDEASEEQNSVLSNFKVNKFSTFGSGFIVDYVTQPAVTEDVYARYEGKILDVLNDDPSTKSVLVDKSYEQYGQDIGAIMNSEKSVDGTQQFREYFIRYPLKDKDNLYTYLVAGEDDKSLIINFKPVNTERYPGAIAYKLLEPLSEDVEELDMVYMVEEVTPSLTETVNLIPFIEEKIPETVLRLPKLEDVDSPIRDRSTKYLSHVDIVGSGSAVREQLEDRLLSGSLETAQINVDYRQYKNFSHFGSVEKRFKNFKYKLELLESYTENSASLTGNYTGSGYLGNASGSTVVSASVDIAKWELKKRETINGFDDFENYMYFQSSSYITSSNGEFYDNAAPKVSGDGSLISPYVIAHTTSSAFLNWYNGSIASASLYDRTNTNRLVYNLPEHITYDVENSQFITFMDMMGHHYDLIWTHIKALTDVHDRSEDVTKGISQALVEPVAKSLGFDMKEGRDLVRLPQYHLGLQESGSDTGVYSVRFTKKSQKDVTREIWNRILSTMPYMLKSKGTKQSLKALIAAYGIPTSILRVQEYGGPKLDGKSDFEVKARFTKALDFKGAQYVQVPWYDVTVPYTKSPDTIEFRFKTGQELDQLLATKINSTNKIEAAIYLTNDGTTDGQGNINFVLSGSTNASMSIASQPFYNNQYWSVMVRRRKGSISSSYEDQTLQHNTGSALTQSYDMFIGYYDAGTDEISVKASSSMTVTGSLNASWYQTGSAAVDNNWFIGGKFDDASKGEQLSGSIMEFRYWNTPLSESAFYNHVAAPKAVNGNHASSSYFDLSLRLSMDDNINLNSQPNGLKDYTVTDGQTYATASGFANEIPFSNVSDRQKAFIPNIGFGKSTNKIRIEANRLRTPDGAPGVLSPNERVEFSAYDLASNDSGKLGIFFAPTDVINEDIILSVADLDYGKYLGDPRDQYEERYTYGRFDRVADTYWKKWTTKQGFWDYIKLIKYYDLSLFDHLRKLSPGRAQKTLGILIEPTMLERNKVIMGKKPSMENLRKEAKYDLTDFFPSNVSGSQKRHRGIVDADDHHILSSSNLLYRSSSIDSDAYYSVSGSQNRYRGIANELGWFITGSNSGLNRKATLLDATGSLLSSRIDYKTTRSETFKVGGSFRGFSIDYLQDAEDRDYTDVKIYTGGGSDIFLEAIPPMVTESRMSERNEQYEFYYTSALSASLKLPSSSSLVPSRFESIYKQHTGLERSFYAGCKEDGSSVPFGNELAVEITEVNPYALRPDDDGTLDVELDLE